LEIDKHRLHAPAENTSPEHGEGEKEMNGFISHESNSRNSLDIVNIQVATDKFRSLNRQARFANFWNRLTGRPGTLLTYEHTRALTKRITNLDRGLRVIPLESIVGSVGRATDYDRQFRPLNPALENRWINVHVLSEQSGKTGTTGYPSPGTRGGVISRHRCMNNNRLYWCSLSFMIPIRMASKTA
jgi:hypothetical protein